MLTSTLGRFEGIFVWPKNALDKISVAVFNDLGDLISAKPENHAVFVVVPLPVLGENVTANLGDNKVAFSNEVYGPRPVLRAEQSIERLERISCRS